MKALFLKPPLTGSSKNVVRDFVYGCWCNGRRVGGMQVPPLNDIYVATYAREAGLDILFLDAQFEPEKFNALMKNGLPEIAVISLLSSTQSFQSDIVLLSKLKQINPNLRTILFGSHPTFMPRYCLSSPAVDYIVLREPEASLSELMLAIVNDGDISNVQGIGYRDNDGNMVLTECRPFLDMDKLPIPDRSLLPTGIDYFNPVIKKQPYTTMQTSRGCPAKCIFCTAPEFYGCTVRYRSIDNIFQEFHEIKRLGYREIFFRDETFTAYKRRNLAVCQRMIDEKLNLSWIANGRVDMIDKETMLLMKRAGCHMLKFGVETGNPEIMRQYRKGITIEQTQKAFALANEIGMETHAHLVVGGPGETPETLASTVNFVKALTPTTASFGVLTPYPGTELFRRVSDLHPEIQDGSDSNMENLHIQGFYSEAICNMSGTELSKWVVYCYRKFYFRLGYISRRLFSIRSFSEFMILLISGLNVFSFSLRGKK